MTTADSTTFMFNCQFRGTLHGINWSFLICEKMKFKSLIGKNILTNFLRIPKRGKNERLNAAYKDNEQNRVKFPVELVFSIKFLKRHFSKLLKRFFWLLKIIQSYRIQHLWLLELLKNEFVSKFLSNFSTKVTRLRDPPLFLKLSFLTPWKHFKELKSWTYLRRRCTW